MRRVIFQNLTSVDGYFEGPAREIDWHNVDGEFNELAIDFLNSVDILLFGRVTYELMASYWPTPKAIADDPIVAGKMNSLSKVVFSRTMTKAVWTNTRVVNGNAVEEIRRLKQGAGKDIAIFGSSDLAVSVLHSDIIDEIRILVNPIVLGGGKPLLHGIAGRLQLKLLGARTFASGNVMLSYHPLPLSN